MLVFSSGVYGCQLKPGVDLGLLLAVLAAATLTGNSVYALNAYYDVEASLDKENKLKREVVKRFKELLGHEVKIRIEVVEDIPRPQGSYTHAPVISPAKKDASL